MNVIPIRRTKKLCNRFSSFNVNQTEKGTIGGFIGGPKATNHTKVANDEVWSCLHVALTIYLLAYLIAAQLSSSRLKLLINGYLETLVVSKDLNQAVMINSNANSLTSISKEPLKMARGLKLIRAVHIIKQNNVGHQFDFSFE